jgi:hypothetical protein
MGGIGLKEQLLMQMHLVERKHMHKWYMKLFRRLLNDTVLNAMIIYRHNTAKQIDQLALSTWWRCFANSSPILNAKYQVARRQKMPFRNCRKDISSTKFLLLAKNHHQRGDVW